MLFNNKLFNSIACLLSFTNLQLVIPGRTWILLYLGRTMYKRLWACLALYKDHKASHRGANSAPCYNNPLLSAHTLSKRGPSGRGNNGQRCGKCGKSHERGNCPVYGKTCDKCKGINHFKAVCRSKVTAKMAQSPHRSKKSHPQRHGSTGSYSGQGKGGGNCQHQKKKTPKKPPK